MKYYNITVNGVAYSVSGRRSGFFKIKTPQIGKNKNQQSRILRGDREQLYRIPRRMSTRSIFERPP